MAKATVRRPLKVVRETGADRGRGKQARTEGGGKGGGVEREEGDGARIFMADKEAEKRVGARET